MTTTLTLAYEGPGSCADCQRGGVPVCAHIGFNDEAWAGMRGQAVHAPGLDQACTHVLRAIEISSDRKTVTLTIDTHRPSLLEMARHLSTLTDRRAKAAVRCVHHETGDVLADGRYDAFLQPGQEVYVNGESHLVADVEHPNRNVNGIAEGIDLQVVRLVPNPQPPIQAVSGGA